MPQQLTIIQFLAKHLDQDIQKKLKEYQKKYNTSDIVIPPDNKYYKMIEFRLEMFEFVKKSQVIETNFGDRYQHKYVEF